MDVVAFYDGSYNSISHNTIEYGNTAGIYLACAYLTPCGEHNATVWDNTVSYFREHGVDIDQCTDCVIVTNTVSQAEQASLSLANSTGGSSSIRYNVLRDSGKWMNTYGNDFGSLTIAGNTNGITDIAYNAVFASNNYYNIWFFQESASPSGNVVTNNDLYASGSSTYISGNYGSWNTSNTTSPNNLW